MKKITFLLVGLLTSIISTAQVTIVEITEAEAISLLDSLKKNGIGHTHTKQWSDDFVNLEASRNAYLSAIVKINQLIMPDQINLNEKYDNIMLEYGSLISEIKLLEDTIADDSFSKILNLKRRVKEIEEIEFSKNLYFTASLFERSIEEFYKGLETEIGDTTYVYSSGLPGINEYLDFDNTRKYTFVTDGTTEYSLNTTTVYFGIICNRDIRGKMYANR
jgi:hypothetical protein